MAEIDAQKICPMAAKLIKSIAQKVNGNDIDAMTVGGVVLILEKPTDPVALDRLRRHEQVHIEQQAARAPWWAKWMPIGMRAWAGLPKFGPEYLAEHRAHGYAGNKFEIEAYTKAQ